MVAVAAARTATQRAQAADRLSTGAPDEVPPHQFGSRAPLARQQMLAAPLRPPRPSRLQLPLKSSAPKLAGALQTLGIATVGDLLEHLPRQLRASRTVQTLRVGEQATIAVQVSSIERRTIRRRGGRSLTLVEASVFDRSGAISATFFNQPWLVERYHEGTRLVLHGSPRP